MTTVRSFRPRERCIVNGYLVEVERQSRRSTFVRVLDCRLPGRVVVQLDRRTPAVGASGPNVVHGEGA